MKLAFIYGPFGGARAFDLDHLYDSPRGLTGSEISFFKFAEAMEKRGHAVHRFFPAQGIEPTGHFDVAYSWNDPHKLQFVSATVRMMNQQLNDFDYCQPGYDEHVDVYTSPSQPHRDFIAPKTPSPHKWTVLPNGCDPSVYTAPKVPGRVIYASSPDRGLHLVMQAWPAIKKAVP